MKRSQYSQKDSHIFLNHQFLNSLNWKSVNFYLILLNRMGGGARGTCFVRHVVCILYWHVANTLNAHKNRLMLAIRHSAIMYRRQRKRTRLRFQQYRDKTHSWDGNHLQWHFVWMDSVWDRKAGTGTMYPKLQIWRKSSIGQYYKIGHKIQIDAGRSVCQIMTQTCGQIFQCRLTTANQVHVSSGSFRHYLV